MIGRNWTGRTTIVRVSAVLPALALLTPKLPLPVAFAIGAVWILWMGFVCARVAINDHRTASETTPFRPTRRSR